MRATLAASLLALVAATACGPSSHGAAPPSNLPPGGTAPAGAPPPTAMLGATKEYAIEVCNPQGQQDYLLHLRCGDGHAPSFDRSGNVGMRYALAPGDPEPSFEVLMDERRRLGPGEVDHHIVDQYELRCADGTHVLFLDMYHCAQPSPTVAPAGFVYAP